MSPFVIPESALAEIGHQAAQFASEGWAGDGANKPTLDRCIYALMAYVADMVRPYGITESSEVWRHQDAALMAFFADMRASGHFPEPIDIEWTADAKEMRAFLRIKALGAAHIAFRAISKLPPGSSEDEHLAPMGWGFGAMHQAVRELVGGEGGADDRIISAWDAEALNAFMAEYDRLREAWNPEGGTV